jgi:hypothetical protein
MAQNFEFRGYTVITSLSHGLLGPLKRGLDRLGQFSRSSNTFLGGGAALGGFPDPSKVILAPGCMKDALFDEDLPEEDRDYRGIFGDRAMPEVQGYVKRIHESRVRFREDPDGAGDVDETVERLVGAFGSVGIELGGEDRQRLSKHLS